MCFVNDNNIFNQDKWVSRINLFWGYVRFIFDTVETDACNPHKRYFIEIKMKINPKKLKKYYPEIKNTRSCNCGIKIEDDKGSQVTMRVMAFYLTPFTNDLRLMYQQGVIMAEGSKWKFKVHSNAQEPNIYSNMEIKSYQPGFENTVNTAKVTLPPKKQYYHSGWTCAWWKEVDIRISPLNYIFNQRNK